MLSHKLKDSFTNIAGPHENLFQCQASAGAWTVTSGGNGVGDLNVASNNSPGLAYGPVGAVLNPTCGIQPGYTAPGSGEYQVQAIACDACQHLGGTRTRRSRYSAFVLKNIEYLLETIDPDFREEFDLAANQAWADEAEFTGLKILKKSQDENHGIVEFQAEFIHKGNKYIHHEISHFRKIKDRWYFSSGEVL